MYEWQMSIDKEVGTNKNSRNKLRFYRLFKRFFAMEEYCKLNMAFAHRAAYAKFRCGVAPLKVETGRYLGQPLEARICPFCPNRIEDEQHVILHCPASKQYTHIFFRGPAYDSLRQHLFRKASNLCEGFCRNDDIEKIIVLFSTKSLVRIVAKTGFLILRKRNNILYIYISLCYFNNIFALYVYIFPFEFYQ